MKAVRLVLIMCLAVVLTAVAGCKSEKSRIEGFKEDIGLEYHADLDLARADDGKGFILDVTEIFDIAKRPSSGNPIMGVKIADKTINHKVIGADEYEYVEEPDGIKILLGKGQEFKENEAGSFRLRLTRKIPVPGSPSGIFRRRLTFTPAPVSALVTDAKNPEGYTAVPLNTPDLGYIILHTKTALGDKQPPGGRRSPDRRSLTYAIPADMASLKTLTFTYFPSRFGFYVGTFIGWLINRIAWMLLGIVLYLWWRNSREKRAKERSKMKMVKKKEPAPEPKALPPVKE